MQQTFLDIIYKIFYDTAQRDFKDIQLILSEKFNFPSIEFEPQTVVKVPIPRKTPEGTIYCGNFFPDTTEDQTTAWGLFLSTIYKGVHTHSENDIVEIEDLIQHEKTFYFIHFYFFCKYSFLSAL